MPIAPRMTMRSRDFTSSPKPCVPKMRLSPAIGDSRSMFGDSASVLKLKPSTAGATKVASRHAPISGPTARSSSPIDHPALVTRSAPMPCPSPA